MYISCAFLKCLTALSKLLPVFAFPYRLPETERWPPLKGEVPAEGRRRGLLNQIITEAATRSGELIK